MKEIAAFFDIDGTIYREGLITEMFKKMITHELIAPERYTNEVRSSFTLWNERKGDYDDYLNRMVEIFKEVIVGLSHEHIDFIAQKVVEQKGDRVYLFTRNEIERHRREGHKLIAISGSPLPLVKEMAEKYHFDDYRGTIYQTDENGVYTGGIVPMWDAVSKKKALLEMKEKYDLNLEDCWSYGDTNGDTTMFKFTGHPTAINPTNELLHTITCDETLLEKMRIIVERKDVIYNIDPKNMRLEK